jgi:hypothetical protein
LQVLQGGVVIAGRRVSAGYFGALGIPLMAAREVMVVNETFARHFFGGESPVAARWGPKRATTGGRSSASEHAAVAVLSTAALCAA